MTKLYRRVFLVFFLSSAYSGFAQKSIDAGYYHSLFLCEDSTVWISGSNENQELTTDTIPNAKTPIYSGLDNIVAIASGGNHSLALSANGTVYAWGENKYGQLGNGNNTSTNEPQLLVLENIVKIFTGESSSFALRTDGTLFAWGKNEQAQLGIGNKLSQNEPIELEERGFIKVSSGKSHTLAIKDNGTLWSWGSNHKGQLGIAGVEESLTPVLISGVLPVKDIASGAYHSLFLTDFGSVYSFGFNEFGTLGHGNNTDYYTPTQVAGLNNVTEINASEYSSYAVLQTKESFGWGINNYGQLGIGNYQNQNLPLLIDSGLTHLSGRNYHQLALVNDTISAWGYNRHYQLGDSSTSYRNTPITVKLGCKVKQITPACFTDAEIVATTPTSICEGENINLESMSYNTYDQVWLLDNQPIDSSESIVLPLQTAGNYQISLIANPKGCSDTASIIVHVDEMPQIILTAPAEVCENETPFQIGINDSSGTWSGAVATSEFNPSVLGTGTHQVFYTVENGACEAQETENITVNPLPSASFLINTQDSVVTITNNSVNATQFYWTFGDGETSNASEPTYVYSDGSYNIVLIATNNCGTEIAQQQVTIFTADTNTTTSLNEEILPNITVYPNPTKGNTTLITNNVKQNTIAQIIDVSGRVVHSVVIKGNTTELSMTNLAQGVYQLIIPTEKGMLTEKIVLR